MLFQAADDFLDPTAALEAMNNFVTIRKGIDQYMYQYIRRAE